MVPNIKLVAVGVAVVGVLAFALFSSNDGRDLPDGIISANGRIEGVQVDIATKIAGRVEEVLVRQGDLVKPGTVLARIDAAQLNAQLQRSKANVASAKSQVTQAQAQIAQVKAELKLHEAELDRARRLVKLGHTSQETFDTRISQRDVAKANLAAVEATLVSRERGIDAAVAERKQIESLIKDCVLIAPTIGRVLYRIAEPGEVLAAGTKVMTLVNLAEVYMEVYLPASASHRLAINSDARIVIDGTDFAVPAKVTFVSPEAQFTPKQVETTSEREKLMFRVKVRVPTELIERHIDFVKTGIRGVAFVRLGINPPDWPAWLEKRFEPPTKSKPAKSESVGRS